MEKIEFSSYQLPAAIGPYSQGIVMGQTLYLSGQIGLDPETQEMVLGGLEAQAKQIFTNISNGLNATGSGMDRVLKVTVILKDIADFQKINDIYGTFFQPPYPARAVFGDLQLPKEAEIMVDLIAAV